VNVGTQREARGELAHLRTLKDCVRQFVKDHGSEGTHDKVIPFVLKSKTLPQAIRRAIDGAMENGKKFHFGTCIRNSSKAQWEENLYAARKVFTRLRNFDHLYDEMATRAPWGIGDFYKYVVAQRVGAYLKLEPVHYVYLHAGPRRGYKALFGRNPKGHRVLVIDFPKEMQGLKPSKIEDMLCEFRETFPRIEWRR
jgi:hypothetical protein